MAHSPISRTKNSHSKWNTGSVFDQLRLNQGVISVRAA
ncbi:hypothetical protein SynSYN20_00523 [Synechococcus sp. SYN20]|nr:hypothetical protein SynSYN20_00523 [Synechococcus sp. SYN20]